DRCGFSFDFRRFPVILTPSFKLVRHRRRSCMLAAKLLFSALAIGALANAHQLTHEARGALLAASPLFLFAVLGPWATSDTANASHLSQALAPDGYPPSAAWDAAEPIIFNTDWQGKNPDPELETQVRLLWTAETLYLHFRSRYRTVSVFTDANPNGRR